MKNFESLSQPFELVGKPYQRFTGSVFWNNSLRLGTVYVGSQSFEVGFVHRLSC